MIEGPRGVRPEDETSLRALTDRVMRVGLVDQYPQLFDTYNFENLSVCADDGIVVSHVGMVERGASLLGCTIRVGGIGGVCTDPDYRNRGLASLCFDRALEKARADGVDIMQVSGDRSLYRQRGCVHVGKIAHYVVAANAIPSSIEAAAQEVRISVATDAQMQDIQALYRSEPVRYLRLPADYRFARQSTYVMNRPSDFWAIQVQGDLRAYVIQMRAEPGASAGWAELAGDRHALVGAIPHLLRQGDLASLTVPVGAHDRLLANLFASAGLAPTHRTAPGTSTLVNFPQLMEKLRPYLIESLGDSGADLRFAQEQERYRVALGDEDWSADRATMARLLFGNEEGWVEPENPLPGALGEALRTALPLPALYYGINYV